MGNPSAQQRSAEGLIRSKTQAAEEASPETGFRPAWLPHFPVAHNQLTFLFVDSGAVAKLRLRGGCGQPQL